MTIKQKIQQFADRQQSLNFRFDEKHSCWTNGILNIYDLQNSVEVRLTGQPWITKAIIPGSVPYSTLEDVLKSCANQDG